MRTLVKLTLVATAIVSLSGCSCGWPRWLCRGDDCGNCTSPYGGSTYGSPSLIAPSYLPSQELPQTLPGPVTPST